jgi:hypothetical protein
LEIGLAPAFGLGFSFFLGGSMLLFAGVLSLTSADGRTERLDLSVPHNAADTQNKGFQLRSVKREDEGSHVTDVAPSTF